MRLFLRYLRSHLAVIAAITLFCAIFALSFYLYELPAAAVWYPALLCSLAGMIFLLRGFLRERARHKALVRLYSQQSPIIDALPEPRSIADEDYIALIRALEAERTQLITDMNAHMADMMDYYTVWAHQIKTPIASMLLALRDEDSPLSREMTAGLFRIEQYAEMAMAFVRLGSEQTDYVIRQYDLDTIIRRCIRHFSREFIRSRISLVYEGVHYAAVTDEKWLEFVIEQLLSNALKYTKQGSVHIYMTGSTLCIEDTGIGIAAEDLPRIFEKGYTGYNGREGKKASGLGLYLCKTVCRRIGHGISARSELGKGTCICLDLTQRPAEIY